MKTFIRVVEYWVPNADSGLLELGGGLFGDAQRLAAISKDLCFGRGEGLPGQAWEAGHPLILKQLDGSYFRRAAAARAAGLTCGIAVPLFVDGQLRSVTVLFCGDDEEHAGAIELWSNDPSASKDMTLVDGYYGTTGDTFEFISRSMAFRHGSGLPGMAWEKQTPVFLPDLGKGSGFLRADGEVKVGINRGFSIPCASSDGRHYVMAFLSALATPIARRVEVWLPDADGTCLTRVLGFSEDSQAADTNAAKNTVQLNDSSVNPLAFAFSTGVPAIGGAMVAVPVGAQGKITSVIALYL